LSDLRISCKKASYGFVKNVVPCPEGANMRTAIVDGPPSLARAGLAAGLALTALLPLGLHRTAYAQESTAARVARENLPSERPRFSCAGAGRAGPR